MSYSRWITSDFYTYWRDSRGANIYSKEDELFALHASLGTSHLFTYTECEEFIKEPKKIRDRVKDVELTELSLDELTLYMIKFIEDVDLSYEK